MNDAIGEIKSLEAAIDLLGPASVHAKPLLTALKAAQERSKVGPIQERLDSCRQFIERAKKRVLRADEVISSRKQFSKRKLHRPSNVLSCSRPQHLQPPEQWFPNKSRSCRHKSIFWCGSEMQ